MDPQFRERLRASIKNSGLILKEIATITGVNKRTLENWTSAAASTPRADDAARVAMAIGTTVEELAEGEKGREYVFSLAGKAGYSFKGDSRLAEIVKELDGVSDEDLGIVLSMVHACAEKTRRLNKCLDGNTG